MVIANKMESKGEPGKINVSASTKEILEGLETSNYSFEYNKKVVINSISASVDCFFVNYELKEQTAGTSND